jgi:putative membrane protein
MVATVLIAVVALIHVYIVVLETVLFRTRGAKVFGLDAARAEMMAPAMSNQGSYNGFLVAALAIALLAPDPKIAGAFGVFGLLCVIVAGVWGAVTVSKRILYVQAVPAALALAARAAGI